MTKTQPMHRMDKGAAGSRGHLEVFGPAGVAPWRHPLTGNHQLIGRSPNATVVLDHSTVSRLHAELVLGPFGHWWVHDLGSTNGTLVNGTPISERMLNPGDRIRIGDFTLAFHVPGHRVRLPSLAPPAPESVTMVDEVQESEEQPPISQAEPTLVTVHPELRESPRINASHISTVMDLGRQLMSVENASARMQTLCQFMVGSDFPGEWAVVLRMRRDTPVRLVSGPVYRSPGFEQGRYISSSVLNSVWETREPVLATNRPIVEEQVGVSQLSIPSMVRMIAVVACPLELEDDKVDALYVELPPAYATAEWLSLVTLIADAFRQAELVWEMRNHVRASAAVERELEMARHIQDALVPRTVQFEGFDVSIGFEPCRWVGGDYVDAISMPDGRLLLAIADVCGKGLQAALIASSLHTMVRARLDTDDNLLMLVHRINNYLCRYLPDHSFVTMLCMAIEPRTGAVECVNAGHPPALVVDAKGRVRKLQSEQNTALGMIQAEFVAEHSELDFSEALLMYTDGLTELMDEHQQALGEERLAMGLSSIVAGNPTAAVDDTRLKLIQMLDRYRGSQLTSDDSTFLVARRRSGPNNPVRWATGSLDWTDQ